MSQQSSNNHYTPDYYYDQLNSSIKSSLNYEQEKAIKQILLRSIKVPSKKIVSLEVTFWFFRRFYMVFYLGLDKRRAARRTGETSLSFAFRLLITATTNILVWGITLSLFAFITYYTKSILGIDINPDFHLLDIF